MADPRLTAIDLFAGCGGLTLGLRLAGFRVVGAIEKDALAAESYRVNHPETRMWRADITSLSPRDLAVALNLRRGDLDLLSACPPCQGFSRLRTGNGTREVDDPRNDLAFEFVRFVDEFRPKAAIMENVPGMMRDTRLAGIMDKLGQLGYAPSAQTFDAADYGVPQRRRRMILLAGRGTPMAFSEPTGTRHTVSDAIRCLPQAGESGDALHDWPERRSPRTMRLIRHIPHDGGSRRDLPDEFQLTCHRNVDGYKDVYGRMAWGDVAPTITSGCTNPSKGRFLHPVEDRAITLREAALLQSFPLDYRFDLDRGKGAAARMIGNAFPPEFVRQHASALHDQMANLRRGHGS